MSHEALRHAYDRFNPDLPLQGDALEAYYLRRPNAPLEQLKSYLSYSDKHVKVLFSGHRGCGKSTELHRLARDLQQQFFIVPVTARKLDVPDLNYVDIILACAAGLFREATRATWQVAIPEDLWDQVFTWMSNEITRQTTIATPISGSASAKINAMAFSLEGKYGKEVTTRTMLLERLSPRVNDLIDHFNNVCEQVEAVIGRPPLIIFEDIDKAPLAQARKIFFDHAPTLNSPACRIIYTYPISLSYSSNFTAGSRDYGRRFILPNVSVFKRDDSHDDIGRNLLHEVVAKRMSPELFEPGALDMIIELSGGLMRDLVRMVGEAILEALNDHHSHISCEMVERVADESADDFRRLLLPEHYKALNEARSTHSIVPNEVFGQLLENLSLLEYRDKAVWCDVHPIVRRIL